MAIHHYEPYVFAPLLIPYAELDASIHRAANLLIPYFKEVLDVNHIYMATTVSAYVIFHESYYKNIHLGPNIDHRWVELEWDEVLKWLKLENACNVWKKVIKALCDKKIGILERFFLHSFIAGGVFQDRPPGLYVRLRRDVYKMHTGLIFHDAREDESLDATPLIFSSYTNKGGRPRKDVVDT